MRKCTFAGTVVIIPFHFIICVGSCIKTLNRVHLYIIQDSVNGWRQYISTIGKVRVAAVYNSAIDNRIVTPNDEVTFKRNIAIQWYNNLSYANKRINSRSVFILPKKYGSIVDIF